MPAASKANFPTLLFFLLSTVALMSTSLRPGYPRLYRQTAGMLCPGSNYGESIVPGDKKAIGENVMSQTSTALFTFASFFARIGG